MPAEELPSTHSEPEEPISPAHVSSPCQQKVKKKSSKNPEPPKPSKTLKTSKAPKVSKVKEGGHKKLKKAKEPPTPLKPSSFAALESHAKDILGKMEQPKKMKVSRWFILHSLVFLTFPADNQIKITFQAVKNALTVSEKETSKQNNKEKFEVREQNKNKTEARWKYKVSGFFWHGLIFY